MAEFPQLAPPFLEAVGYDAAAGRTSLTYRPAGIIFNARDNTCSFTLEELTGGYTNGTSTLRFTSARVSVGTNSNTGATYCPALGPVGTYTLSATSDFLLSPAGLTITREPA
ncbi:MAG TPA: hypothetical protein VHJ17_21800 [Thermomonospora sp.]|nr:hypothetical protein [Thermomonospora sp.]